MSPEIYFLLGAAAMFIPMLVFHVVRTREIRTARDNALAQNKQQGQQLNDWARTLSNIEGLLEKAKKEGIFDLSGSSKPAAFAKRPTSRPIAVNRDRETAPLNGGRKVSITGQ